MKSFSKIYRSESTLNCRSRHLCMPLVLLEQRITVNSEWYTTIYLPVVFQEIRKINRRRRLTLHHDNASSHTSAKKQLHFWGLKTSIWWVVRRVVLTWHQMTSYIKNKMRDQHFSTPEEALEAFRMHVLEIPQSQWQKCFNNWFKRMQKCIDLNGECFEKQ